MIISHKHKFIFIKSPKTASTSVEIALSRYCGPDDMITPIQQGKKKMNADWGVPPAQNISIPFLRYTPTDILRVIKHRQWLRFRNHARASFIRNHIDREIWDSYYKFCFERNPWDKVISLYYWKYRKTNPPPLTKFVFSRAVKDNIAFDMYSEKSRVIVDKVYRYEDMDEALEDIRCQLNLPEPLLLPQTKHTVRKDRRHYREVLSDKERHRIARVFSREIDLLDYQW